MSNEIYMKVVKTITEYVIQLLDDKDDSYLWDNKDRVIEKFIEEICNENKQKMKSCTEVETTAYRKMMGLDTDGEKKNYKQVGIMLNRGNARDPILNANRKLMHTIYKEILFEDKIRLIQIDYENKKNKSMLLPEDIEIDDLNSIIYFEKESLRQLGIENVFDITSFSKQKIKNILSGLNSKRKNNKKDIGNELVEAIHLLGYLFIDEEGYKEQQEEFNKIREKEKHKK